MIRMQASRTYVGKLTSGNLFSIFLYSRRFSVFRFRVTVFRCYNQTREAREWTSEKSAYSFHFFFLLPNGLLDNPNHVTGCMTSFLLFLFSLKVSFCSCHPEKKRSGFRSGRSHYTVSRVGQLAPVVNESSGLVYRPTRNTFWTHNDSGGRPTLYEVSRDGSLVDSLPLPHLKNRDWEALSSRDSTTLFIGDIGNNANARTELTIYRIDPRQPNDFQPITFHYANQQSFPATKDTRNFDSEALFFAKDSLFLISKNRSEPRRFVNLYGLPAKTGDYALTPIDSVFLKSMVTDAALSPDGRTLAVLAYGKIFFFDQTKNRVGFQHPTRCLRVPRGQTEGLTFVNNTDLVMTNEAGKMYLIRWK